MKRGKSIGAAVGAACGGLAALAGTARATTLPESSVGGEFPDTFALRTIISDPAVNKVTGFNNSLNDSDFFQFPPQPVGAPFTLTYELGIAFTTNFRWLSDTGSELDLKSLQYPSNVSATVNGVVPASGLIPVSVQNNGEGGSWAVTLDVVPEPATGVAAIGGGLAALALRRKRLPQQP